MQLSAIYFKLYLRCYAPRRQFSDCQSPIRASLVSFRIQRRPRANIQSMLLSCTLVVLYGFRSLCFRVYGGVRGLEFRDIVGISGSVTDTPRSSGEVQKIEDMRRNLDSEAHGSWD